MRQALDELLLIKPHGLTDHPKSQDLPKKISVADYRLQVVILAVILSGPANTGERQNYPLIL